MKAAPEVRLVPHVEPDVAVARELLGNIVPVPDQFERSRYAPEWDHIVRRPVPIDDDVRGGRRQCPR